MRFQRVIELHKRRRMAALFFAGSFQMAAGVTVFLLLYALLRYPSRMYYRFFRLFSSDVPLFVQLPRPVVLGMLGLLLLWYPLQRWKRTGGLFACPGNGEQEPDDGLILLFAPRLIFCGLGRWIDALRLGFTPAGRYLPLFRLLYAAPGRVETAELEQAAEAPARTFLPLLTLFDATAELRRPPGLALSAPCRELWKKQLEDTTK